MRAKYKILLFWAVILNITCQKEPIHFTLTDISITQHDLSFRVISNKIPDEGTIAAVYSDKDLIVEVPIPRHEISEVKIAFNKLTSKAITQIASVLSKSDSIELSLIITSNGKPFLEHNIKQKGFKHVISNKILISNTQNYEFNKSELLKSDYEKIFLDIIKFNKVYINKVEGFNSSIPIVKPNEEFKIVCTLPKSSNYKIWLTDKKNSTVNLTKMSISTLDSFKVYQCKLSQPEKNLNGIYHLNIFDDESQLTYLFPVINIDGSSPILSLSKEHSLTGFDRIDNSFVLDLLIDNPTETNGYVKISHGNWESNGFFAPITLKVYVSGDVEKLYFDGEPLKFKINQSKYITVNLSTHVGVNAFEVKAIDKRGNISTEDYIIEAQSNRNNRTIIENNINIDND